MVTLILVMSIINSFDGGKKSEIQKTTQVNENRGKIVQSTGEKTGLNPALHTDIVDPKDILPTDGIVTQQDPETLQNQAVATLRLSFQEAGISLDENIFTDKVLIGLMQLGTEYQSSLIMGLMGLSPEQTSQEDRDKIQALVIPTLAFINTVILNDSSDTKTVNIPEYIPTLSAAEINRKTERDSDERNALFAERSQIQETSRQSIQNLQNTLVNLSPESIKELTAIFSEGKNGDIELSEETANYIETMNDNGIDLSTVSPELRKGILSLNLQVRQLMEDGLINENQASNFYVKAKSFNDYGIELNFEKIGQIRSLKQNVEILEGKGIINQDQANKIKDNLGDLAKDNGLLRRQSTNIITILFEATRKEIQGEEFNPGDVEKYITQEGNTDPKEVVGTFNKTEIQNIIKENKEERNYHKSGIYSYGRKILN